MEFIAKLNSEKCFPHYLLFETKSWNITELRYFGYNFDGFSLIKSDIRDILIQEQNKLCCYCQKELKFDSTTTFEHIIPQNPKDGFDFLAYNIPCIDANIFSRNSRTIPNYQLDNLPHDISYYNILGCCRKCNSQRGNDDVTPFVFDKDVKQKIHYDDDGNIFSSEYFKEVAIIGLASDYYLKNRKIWKQLKLEFGGKKLPLNNDELIKKIKLIGAGFYNDDKDLFYLNLLSDESAVHDVLMYNYFYKN